MARGHVGLRVGLSLFFHHAGYCADFGECISES